MKAANGARARAEQMAAAALNKESEETGEEEPALTTEDYLREIRDLLVKSQEAAQKQE